LVTDLSRRERSTFDLLQASKERESRRAPAIAINGLRFDLVTAIVGVADFERELIQERIRSNIAAANAWGKRLAENSPRNKIKRACIESARLGRLGPQRSS
jgi:putative DNA-invertase from lambdoid prophage Rac